MQQKKKIGIKFSKAKYKITLKFTLQWWWELIVSK